MMVLDDHPRSGNGHTVRLLSMPKLPSDRRPANEIDGSPQPARLPYLIGETCDIAAADRKGRRVLRLLAQRAIVPLPGREATGGLPRASAERRP